MANIKNVTLSGDEIEVKIGGQNTEIRNDGAATVYASANAGIVAGADGVVAIPAGAAVTVLDTRGRVYLLGTGEVSIVGKDTVSAVFKCAPTSGGSGEDDVARQAINKHAGNAEIHVTADEKAAWNGKAELTDIPTTLPANGGNADTVGEKHASDFALAENNFLDDFLSSKSGDIRALVIDLPSGGFGGNTGRLPNIGFPIAGDIIITWFKSVYSNGLRYGTLQVRSMTKGDLPVYQCSVYNDGTYTDWQKLCDGGDAKTLGTHPASDFVLKSELDALAARVAALENGGTT